MNTLWVALGGAAGSVARYQVGLLLGSRTFPCATLLVNLAGSFLLALLMTISLRTGHVPESMRLGLGVGVLGGFTTYSSFNYESMALAQHGQWGGAALYIGATVAGCLLAGLAGWGLAQVIQS